MKIRTELLTNEDEPIGRRCDVPNLSYFVGMAAFESIVDKLTSDIHADDEMSDKLTSDIHADDEMSDKLTSDIHADDEMSDKEKSMRCAEAYSPALAKDPSSAYVSCVVDGVTHLLCKDCPLTRVPE